MNYVTLKLCTLCYEILNPCPSVDDGQEAFLFFFLIKKRKKKEKSMVSLTEITHEIH